MVHGRRHGKSTNIFGRNAAKPSAIAKIVYSKDVNRRGNSR